jgi:hypothetical protein
MEYRVVSLNENRAETLTGLLEPQQAIAIAEHDIASGRFRYILDSHGNRLSLGLLKEQQGISDA